MPAVVTPVSPAPRPLQLVDGAAQPVSSSCPSPALSASGLSTPPPSARKSLRLKPANSRRQSSISYFPSDHAPHWDLRSPVSATPSSPGPSSLQRSVSNGQRPTSLPALKRDRRSVQLLEALPPEDTTTPTADPQAALTLTERHADLLRFIAQKEAKCLELRSQLSTHEAELAQLKRKWERIVSRGMDRAYSSSSPQPSYALDNIREGVQGAARMLAAGLADLSAPPPPPPSSTQPTTPARAAPIPLAIATARRGHGNTQSTSSSDTASSSLTRSSFRLSQSSASSLGADEQAGKTERTESPIEISPANASMAAKLHRRKSRDQAANQADAPPSAWSQTPLTPSRPSTTLADDQEKKKTKRSSLQIAGLPAPSVMPGLGTLASPEVATWMGSVGTSVGKKWEELQKGETFTKNQKRASVLLSDVSQSIFAVLSPSAASASISSSPFATAQAKASPAGSTSLSLLEDDDDTLRLGAVLVPDTVSANVSPAPSPALKLPNTTMKPANAAATKNNKSLLDDDDEWNW